MSEIRCWRYALRYALRLWSRVSFKLIDRLIMCLSEKGEMLIVEVKKERVEVFGKDC